MHLAPPTRWSCLNYFTMRDILRLNRLRSRASEFEGLEASSIPPSEDAQGAGAAAAGVEIPASLPATVCAVQDTLQLVMDGPTPTDAVMLLVRWKQFEDGVAGCSHPGESVEGARGVLDRAGYMLEGLGLAFDQVLQRHGKRSRRNVPRPPAETPQLSDPLVAAIPRAARARVSTAG